MSAASYPGTMKPVFPTSGGTYCLLLQVDTELSLEIGRIGRYEIQPGIYVYLGSARGPGGLRTRLNRHVREGGKTHWHIDHLRKNARLLGVFWTLDPKIHECDWRQDVNGMSGASIPVPGFGASDCSAGCPAHLVCFPAQDNLNQWLDEFKLSLTGKTGGKLYIMG